MNPFSLKTVLPGVLFFILLLVLVVFIAAPSTADAATHAFTFEGSIVPCGRPGYDPCEFCHLMFLGQNVIDFFMFFALTITVLLFIWSGFLYVTAGGDPGQISQAHKIFWAVFMGLLIILLAWTIVDTVMKTFLDESRFGFWNKFECVTPGVEDYVRPPDPEPVVEPPPPGQTFDEAYEEAKDKPADPDDVFDFDSPEFCFSDYYADLPGPPSTEREEAIKRAHDRARSECAAAGGDIVESGGPALCSMVLKCVIPKTIPPIIAVTLVSNDADDRVNEGTPVTLTWNATPLADVASCTASGGTFSGTFTGAQLKNGTAVVTPAVGNTTYTIDCTSIEVEGKTTTATAEVTIQVDPVPAYVLNLTVCESASCAATKGNNIKVDEFTPVTFEWSLTPITTAGGSIASQCTLVSQGGIKVVLPAGVGFSNPNGSQEFSPSFPGGEGTYTMICKSLTKEQIAGNEVTTEATVIVDIVEEPPIIAVTLVSNDADDRVNEGTPVTLTWNATPLADVASCTASGGTFSGTFTGAQLKNGTAVVTPAVGNTTYTIDCTSIEVEGKTTTATAEVTIQVDPVPAYVLNLTVCESASCAATKGNNIKVDEFTPVTFEWSLTPITTPGGTIASGCTLFDPIGTSVFFKSIPSGSQEFIPTFPNGEGTYTMKCKSLAPEQIAGNEVTTEATVFVDIFALPPEINIELWADKNPIFEGEIGTIRWKITPLEAVASCTGGFRTDRAEVLTAPTGFRDAVFNSASNYEFVINCTSIEVDGKVTTKRLSYWLRVDDKLQLTLGVCESIGGVCSGIQGTDITINSGTPARFYWTANPPGVSIQCDLSNSVTLFTSQFVANGSFILDDPNSSTYTMSCESKVAGHPPGDTTSDMQSVSITVLPQWCFESCSTFLGLCVPFTGTPECKGSVPGWSAGECSASEALYSVAGRKVKNSCSVL